MPDNLIIENADGIRQITINRPKTLNALNNATIVELGQAFDAISADPSVRCVVLKGAGTKAFVAGADINELQALTSLEAHQFSHQGQRLMRKIETMSMPVIAAVRGYALGGGCELAMSCTLRILADDAVLGQPEIKLGILPGYGGTQRMLRLAGRSAAMELCLLGNQINAERAYQLGIANRVVPVDQFDSEVETVARQLVASAPLAIGAIITAINHGSECGIDQAVELETGLFGMICASEDKTEGTSAFLEKRKAKFSGS